MPLEASVTPSLPKQPSRCKKRFVLPNCTQIHLKTILSVEVPALPDTVIFHQPLAEFGNRSSSLSNAPGCLRLC